MSQADRIRILHISDLHFGEKSRFKDYIDENICDKLGVRLATPVLEHFKPDLVAVTGDIAHTGGEKDYQCALKFFNSLSENLGLDRDRFVFCPGNHDVNWEICQALEKLKHAAKEIEQMVRSKFPEGKYHYYKWLLNEFYENGIPAKSISDCGLIYDFDDFRLTVAALNSAVQESHNDEDHKGRLGESQITELRDHWLKEKYNNWIKLICLHHNPSPDPADIQRLLDEHKKKNSVDVNEKFFRRYLSTVLGVDDKRSFKKICGTVGVQLILSGHTHYDDGNPWNWTKPGRTELLSVGSFGLERDELPPDQPNQIQLLEIIFEDSAIKYHCRPLHFDPIDEHPDGYSLKFSKGDEKSQYLSLPSGWAPQIPTAAPPKTEKRAIDENHTAVLKEFRRCFKSAYQKWDLSLVGVGVQPTDGGHRPEADLDQMFMPLRMGEGIDREEYKNGEIISPKKLLERGTKPLFIRGQAGSGKTTWMRWTFRRLVESKDTLPVMVTLRDMAKFMEDRKATQKGAALSLPAYLTHWFGQRVGKEELEKAFLNILENPPDGLRPVLLVDGWDELGSKGDEFRELLSGFMNSHLQVLVVASSRPQSESPPDFETLDIQPLNREEIGSLAKSFFDYYYESDLEQIEIKVKDFEDRLDASPEALDLGRTALLLSMLLIVSRTCPLPEKRHELYEQCLKTMLIHGPKYKEKQGEQEHLKCWRPGNSDEVWQAVAGLARQMKGSDKIVNYLTKRIVLEKKDIIPLLPGDWSNEHKEHFVNWLISRAAVLVEPKDDNFSFVHLSFQEYLAAWDLNSKNEGPERINAFKELCQNVQWWETLRLWAALVESKNPGYLEEVMEAISRDKESGFWLAGAMLADGLGKVDRLEQWGRNFVWNQSWINSQAAYNSALAWANSGRKERGEKLAGLLSEIAGDLTWLAWLDIEDWIGQSELKLEDPLPSPAEPAAGWTIASLENPGPSEPLVAFGRVWANGNPIWPAPMEWELAGLRLWPGARWLDSLRVQNLASFRVDPDDLWLWVRVALQPTSMLQSEEISNKIEFLSRYFSRDFSRDFASRDFSRYLSRDFSRDFSRYLSRDFSRNFSRYLSRYFSRDFSRDLSRDLSRDFSRYLSRDFSRDFSRYLSRDFSRYLSQKITEETYQNNQLGRGASFETALSYLAHTEYFINSSFGNRTYLAFIPDKVKNSLANLLKAACRLSLDSNPAPDILNPAIAGLDEKYNHPLWPALARHISRLSDQADRDLLEFASKIPDDYVNEYAPGNDTLRWGLKYYVRGDVMLGDGSVYTLDELNKKFGYDPPPYLEEMGDEVEPEELQPDEEPDQPWTK